MSWLLCLIAVASAGQWATVDATCSWKEFLNTHIEHAIYKSPKSLSECQSACLSSPGCVSVDWNPGQQWCWHLDTQDGKESYPDFNHYDYVCQEACPPGFTSLPSADSCYKVVFESHDWTSAVQKCQQLSPGSHLTDITSAAENNALKIFLASELSKNPGTTACAPIDSATGTSFWTSGQLLDANTCSSSFAWKLSCEEQLPVEFTDWDTGEPNCGKEGYVEACLSLLGKNDLRWNDLPCDLKICPVCEYKP